ncbi:AAA family ATPase [Shewanella waksmanii]|uniref:AAA family ATPase n=1 Tax=Shewanella waksmanii TaxID=213783 RepID=UPI00373611D9
MRPQVLTMVAFGPFATKQVIDFESLGKNPLFLINGPTGAGKTTILDGICFALYGKTTGDEREGSQMRCDLAQDDLLTEVSFQFELGAKQYLIRRVPEQPRLKKSGEGYTVQKSEAQLYRLEQDGQPTPLVTMKVSEATAEIEQLTGLDVDQFRQVMVLPQGKFRELLMADSKSREKIFSQLFQTHIYRKIEDKLKHQAAIIRMAVRDHRNKRDGIMHNAAVESDDAINVELSELSPKVAAALNDNEAAKQQLITANNQLELAKQRLKDFAELEKELQIQQQLSAKDDLLVERQMRLQQGRKALQLHPLFEVMQTRSAEFSQAQQALTTALNLKTLAEQALGEAQLAFDGIEAQENQLQILRQDLQNLQQLAPQLTQIEALQQSFQQQNETLQQAKLQGGKARQQLDELQASIVSNKADIARLELLANEQLSQQQAVNQYHDLVEAHQNWSSACQEVEQTALLLTSAKEQGQILRDKHQQAQQAQRQMQLVWHRGQAASLAQQLNDGMPCPVCGSEQHPSPAVSEQSLPSEDDLQQAQQQEERANQALNQARSDYAGLTTRQQEQQKRLNQWQEKLGQYSQQSFAQLQAEYQSRQQALQQTNLAVEQLKQLRATLNQQELAAGQQQSQLDAERERFQQLQEQVSGLKGKIDQALERVPADFLSLPALQAAIVQKSDSIDSLVKQIDDVRQRYNQSKQQYAANEAAVEAAQKTERHNHEQHLQATKELNDAMLQQGFGSVDELKQALMAESQLNAIAEQIEQEQQQRIANQARLAQLQQKLTSDSKPELVKLESALEQAQQQQQTTEQQWQRLQGRVTQLTQTIQQLAEADAKAKQLEDEYAIVGTLADVANGQTGNKISLQRFVLSVLLDDVLLAASERLQMMSKGRYRLLRKEERAKGNKASGLELEVEDAYTAKVRPVATLSGGESFMAALSMALGLSDVVQAYAGGIKLDTLFIDEGFGSLDQDSLELAIRTLIDLQSAGRMVGVISHVSEMKEQISSRIDLLKTAEGSKATVHAA